MAPHTVQQIVLRDDLVLVFDQVHEQVERLGFEVDDVAASTDLASAHVDLVVTEAVHGVSIPPSRAARWWGPSSASRRSQSGSGVRHPEGEHAAGVDAGVLGAAVEHLGPLLAVAGDVDLEQGLLELGVLGGVDVDQLRVAVHGDGEVFAGEVGGADRRAVAQVAEAHRLGRRPEVEPAAVEDAVDGAVDRAAVAGRGGEHEQPHAGELLGELGGVEAPVRRGDAAQVRSGGLVAAVEDEFAVRRGPRVVRSCSAPGSTV